MCLAIPGEILSIHGDEFEKTGQVHFAGLTKEIHLCLVPECTKGDFILVHAGFAIKIINKQKAKETLEAIERVLESPNEKIQLGDS